METQESDNLQACLDRFRDLANGNQRVRKLIQGWCPVILITPSDESAAFAARVDGAIGAWNSKTAEAATLEADQLITLRAPQAILKQVFSGELNPARAHIDGTLQVFADDRDQVKLDAISLILWGV